MLDFLNIKQVPKKTYTEIEPCFKIGTSSDLMIRGKDFYAIWDEENNIWNTNEQRAIELIDKALYEYWEEEHTKHPDTHYRIMYLWDSSTNKIDSWHKYVQKQLRDNYKQLDSTIIFKSDVTKKEDYATKRLDYDMKPGLINNYNKLVGTLFDPSEKEKLEWAVGSIIAGDSKSIQKFIVLYGEAGTGKSTFINIVQKLFKGYWATFEAKELGIANNQFALEAFKNNPLVAIQHDGDLSNIADNTKLNSIISHEKMVVNEKFKGKYEAEFHSFLIMGTNEPVDLRGSKTGMNRRLIDVRPTGNRVAPEDYDKLFKGVDFEIGAIAQHCYDVYKELGKNYYNTYVPRQMKSETDDFYNFMEDSYYEFIKDTEYIQLNELWTRYKIYCDNRQIKYPLPYRKLRTEASVYFTRFYERYRTDDGHSIRNVYYGFRRDKIGLEVINKIEPEIISSWLTLKTPNADERFIFDTFCADCPAQYANQYETPNTPWSEVTSKLNYLNPELLHYVKIPENHIVIDFDLKDKDGNKSLKLNMEAAKDWPETYAEVSKGGQGLHLHYIYTGGDPKLLSRIYAPDIEIKVFSGNSSLRRKLSKANNLPIVEISSGLPLKENKKMVNAEAIKTEKGLRTLILRNLNKEIHPATKPSIDFIYKILNDCYNNGLKYDVTDMRQAVLIFAANSTHQSDYCIEMVNNMKFRSEEPSLNDMNYAHDEIIFYDIEVFPNLFLVNWKREGSDTVVRMINPTSYEVEDLCKYKLVGFNNRRYDNHIMYAAMNGYNNQGLYVLSQKIINGDHDAFFGEAYNLSYADIYDFSSKKQSLKKWEIELGIHHQELGLPWDQPVAEELWDKVAEYCDNDVIATEAVWNHKSIKQDFVAREILSTLSGLSVNDTTRMHTTKIIFGNEKHPDLVYTDLSEDFPGYEFIKFGEDGKPHNMYRETDLGFGGYVYAEPGMYKNVALLDVASLHPHSIIAMNCFGSYTDRFKDLLDARIFIKHKEFDKAGELLNGALKPFLVSEDQAAELAQALKIVINSVYGYTSATFDNPFKDPRNVNNIVALRGALFMRTLQDEVTSRGFTVAHIKTDSIKIPDATPEIIQFCMDFAKQYGYTFEHEATYDRICLVNDAVYIARYSDQTVINGKHAGEWTATGTQFQIPYVFKTCFSKEPIEFSDMCETKTVSSSIYLDMNENLPEEEHDYHFVGKVGQFCPMKEGTGGGELFREKDGKYYALSGTKGYRWLESEVVNTLHKESDIDLKYYNNLVDGAIETINMYGDFERFASNEPLE